ncbi:MAG TPA: hypothetical protein VGG78_03010, partial [Gemmatimonadaceae bacterium]
MSSSLDVTEMRGDLVFRYRAARANGSVERGVLSAPDLGAARRLLVSRCLLPTAVETCDTEARRGEARTVSAKDLALGLRALATLLSSGLPMTRVLAAFADLAPTSWHRGLPTLRQAVREGHGLSSALSDA